MYLVLYYLLKYFGVCCYFLMKFVKFKFSSPAKVLGFCKYSIKLRYTTTMRYCNIKKLLVSDLSVDAIREIKPKVKFEVNSKVTRAFLRALGGQKMEKRCSFENNYVVQIFLFLLCLSTFSSNSSCKLNILRHDCDTLCVDGAQVCVFEQSNQVGLRGFLKSQNICFC